MSRKELEPADVVALIDTREQRPFELSPMRSERGTLATGDYSVKGLEHEIALERKSLDDFVMCVGPERERFEKECQRLLSYPTRAIVIEASWEDLVRGGWRSRVTPAAAQGSALGWMAMGIPLHFAGTRLHAEKSAARMLFLAARRHWRTLQAFQETLRLA